MDVIANKTKYNQIGGWLYLLCFLLIFGSPIRNIFVIYKEFAEAGSYFKEVKGLESFVYLESIAIGIVMVLSIWSGISLVLIKPNAVKITKFYLILFLIHGLIQNVFPTIAGLDEDFTKGMEYQMKVNTVSAILVFLIWFIYLSVSDRVKETYSNLTLIANSNVDTQNRVDFSSRLNLLPNKIKDFSKKHIIERINKVDIENLSSDEIIISSIILGTLVALILGYYFGETYYFHNNGNRTDEGDYSYEEFHFNYLLGMASLLICGGITYIYLNRKSKKNE